MCGLGDSWPNVVVVGEEGTRGGRTGNVGVEK